MIINASTNIIIDTFKCGVFVFNCNGATGKSRVAKILASLQATGENYSVVTVINGKLSVYGDVDNSTIVMFDRFDLYVSDEWLDKISSIKDRCTVMLDLKQLEKLNCKYGFVDISMFEDRIELRLT